MNLDSMLATFQDSVASHLPAVLGAVAILLVGWIVALLVRAGIRRGLHALGVNARLSRADEKPSVDAERGVAQGGFLVVMLLTVLGALNALNLELVSAPLQGLLDRILGYMPQLAGAALLLLVAWGIATVVRMIVRSALGATGLDDKLKGQEGAPTASESLAQVGYWGVFFLFLPAILGALELRGLLAPAESMMVMIMEYLPRIAGAVIIGLVGWFVARLVRTIVENLLVATNVDATGHRIGLSDSVSISRLVATTVYLLVFVPALVSALNTLEIPSISDPANALLATVVGAIPALFTATLFVGIAVVVGRFLARGLESILSSAGADRLPNALGLAGAEPTTWPVARTAGRVLFAYVLLFAIVEAADRLALSEVGRIAMVVMEFGSQVIVGSAIIVAGYWVASLAYRAMLRASNAQAKGVATILRTAILGIVLAMGLRAMGLADDIVNMAFALTLGAAAVAFALAFGLGARDAAGDVARRWVDQIPSNRSREADA